MAGIDLIPIESRHNDDSQFGDNQAKGFLYTDHAIGIVSKWNKNMTKLSMPQASYKKIVLAITTYYEFGRSATLNDIAEKQLTSPWGYELAKALKFGIEQDIARWWEEIVKKSEFLSSIVKTNDKTNGISRQRKSI